MILIRVLLALLLSLLGAINTVNASCPLPAAPPPTGPNLPSILIINQAYTVPIGSNCSFDYVNVVSGGSIIFEDGVGTTTFTARSILIEQGGVIEAGTPEAPFGASGGHLDIGLWGSAADTVPSISCQSQGGCYPTSAVSLACYNSGTSFDPTNPCQTALTTPGTNQNMYFEGYASSTNPSDPADNYGQFGRKVLAVSYGGTLNLFGKKGVQNPSDSPRASCDVPTAPQTQTNIQNWANLSQGSWARLNANASQGGTNLVLDRTVDWDEGDQLIVGTTDWHVGHSERVTVQSASGTSNTTLTLQGNLANNHNGTPYAVPSSLTSPTTNPNTQVENRAVVGLLSRSITIQSLGPTATDPFPAASDCGLTQAAGPNANLDCYFGGHLMVRQGFAQVQIQGVEFHHLGQGGTIGAYPVHFHLAKDTTYTNAFVKDSSIWESNTRFITLHGTHDVELSRNVGYLSMGHGYYLEDGSEINNLLCNNLGVSGRAAFLQYFQAQEAGDPVPPEARYIPPILNDVNDPTGSGQTLQGADSTYPTMFWMMNAWNEFVGNQAVGLGGFGVCYWPLSSSVSGPSTGLHWAADTSSDLDYANFNQAGQYQAPLKRFRGNGCGTAAYALMTERASLTPGTGQIAAVPPTTSPTPTQVALNPNAPSTTQQPNVASNFYPLQYGTQSDSCSPQPAGASNNNASCVATVVDRFTTSFNWPQQNFGAIWLRPWSWVVVNGAVTDQLFGGLGFVSGGSWDQVLNRQLAIVKDSIFVGSTHPSDSEAGTNGPDMSHITNCSAASFCLFPEDGSGIPSGGLDPKRLLTIYDGPFFSDGNIFAGIGTSNIDPSPSSFISIYDTTQQPVYSAMAGTVSTYTVANAAVGWKQPNFFYYPPAFAFKETAFELNPSAPSTRHNVLDQTLLYTSAIATPNSMTTLNMDGLGVTPVDTTTILNDLDGSLNGLIPVPSGGTTHTSAVSVNPFYDAPNGVAQCHSIGTKTLPDAFVTTVVAQVQDLPTGSSPTNTLNPWDASGPSPAVAVYRQYMTSSTDTPNCSDPNNYKVCLPGQTTACCPRGTSFVGAYIGQAPGLTMNQGIYYLDTNSAQQPTTPLNGSAAAQFSGGSSYAVYNLFGNSETQVTYQLYVGPGFDVSSGFQWITVDPHQGSGGQLQVSKMATASGASTVNYNESTGILTVVLSHDGADYSPTPLSSATDACYPNNLCEINSSTEPNASACTLNSAFNESGLDTQISDVCEYWVTRTTTEVTDSSGAVYLNDCPQGGCLGFAFTLPAGFSPTPYLGTSGGKSVYAASPQPYPTNWPSLTTAPNSLDNCPTPGQEPQYQLTINNSTGVPLTISPGNTTCTNTTCQLSFAAGTQVQISYPSTPPPPANSSYQWSGACQGQGTPCVLTMDADKTVEIDLVTFYSLAMGSATNGVVTSSPTGINCGNAYTQCSANFTANTAIHLTATPNSGNTLTNWNAPDGLCVSQGGSPPNPCTFTITANEAFGAPQFSASTSTNQPPIAMAGPDRTAPVGERITLDGTLSVDPDHGPANLNYQWSQTGGPSETLQDAHTATPSFVPTAPGRHVFRLVVSDGAATSEDEVTADVMDVPVVLLSPNGGEIWKVGTRQAIRWYVSPTLAKLKRPLSIRYSKNNGKAWRLLKLVDASADKAHWTPKRRHRSAKTLLRVCVSPADGQQQRTCDASDQPFKINK